jgi:hypothetical protein
MAQAGVGVASVLPSISGRDREPEGAGRDRSGSGADGPARAGPARESSPRPVGRSAGRTGTKATAIYLQPGSSWRAMTWARGRPSGLRPSAGRVGFRR